MTWDHPTIAPELIACISEGREPTVVELGRVADRIERDLFGERSAFAWGRETDAETRMTCMRIALAALAGEDEHSAPAMSATATAEPQVMSIPVS